MLEGEHLFIGRNHLLHSSKGSSSQILDYFILGDIVGVFGVNIFFRLGWITIIFFGRVWLLVLALLLEFLELVEEEIELFGVHLNPIYYISNPTPQVSIQQNYKGYFSINNKIYIYSSSAANMKLDALKPNHYVIKNGKLTPKPQSTPKSSNYQCIPYTPLNKPTQQDYYQETINKLTQKNTQLKKLVNGIGAVPQQLQSHHRHQCEGKLAQLSSLLRQRENQISCREQEFTEMDRIIKNQSIQIEYQNQILSELNLEIENLKGILVKREKELDSKNEAFHQYQQTIKELMDNQKRKRTTNTEGDECSNGMEQTDEPQTKVRLRTEEEDRYSEDSGLSENLKNWTEWAERTKFLTLDFLQDNPQINPMATLFESPSKQ